MGENWLQEKRRERINILVGSVKKASDAGIGVDQVKLIAQCGIEWGLRKEKVKSYVKELLEADILIEKEDGLIYIKKA